MFNNNLGLIQIVWVMGIILMFVVRQRKGIVGVGLVLTYTLNFSVLYCSASLLYILPWYHGEWEEFTSIGAEVSLYGLLAFAFGSLALSPFLLDTGILPRANGIHRTDPRLPKAYIMVGVISYGILSVIAGQVASLISILATGQELIVVGLGLCCLQAWQNRDAKKTAFWMMITLTLPLFTIVTRGFIGYGATATLSVLLFLSNFVRGKIKVAAAGMLLFYMGLSVYVTYMRDRKEIRASVWGGQSFSDRFDRVSETASQFEWFDPFNDQHLHRVDNRLNQSYLVGAAVEHLEQTGEFAHGETIKDAAVALIPRIFWPDKPVIAGSGNLVNRFTGFKFDNMTTSVGVGQVLEFYANFGITGVIVGFMVFGLVLTTLDVLATERLTNGDLQGFVLFYLPGLAFLPVIGQLTEITSSAAASLIVAMVLNRFLDRLQKKESDFDAIVQGSAAIPGSM